MTNTEDIEEQGAALADQFALMQQFQPTLAEPDEDEIGDDVTFVKNGWVRCTINGTLFKLRRPFLGELQALEQSMEAARQELTEMGEKLRKVGEEGMERAREIQAEARDSKITKAKKAKLDKELTELTTATLVRQKEQRDKADALRILWWEQVFETLIPPGNKKPEITPTWVLDQNLPMQLLAHWREAPLARGNR